MAAGHAQEQATITWTPVAQVQPVVFVAKVDEHPVAIIELRPGAGFRLVSSQGERLGEFSTLAEGQAALTDWLARR